MTARDRFTANLECPICNRSGVAKLSELDGIEYLKGDKTTSVDDMPEGFIEASSPSWISGNFDILCAEHKVSALKRPAVLAP